MKMKQLAAAAALALVAATPAMALISGPETGNGELVLVVVDRTDQASYLLDLGLSLDPGVTGATAFDGNGNYSYSLGGANFQAFLSAAATSGGDLEFAVFGGDVAGTGAGARRLYSTVNQVDTPFGNGLLTNANNNIGGFLGNQLIDPAAPGQTHQTVDNGDNWAAVGSTAYFLTQAMDSYNGVTASQGWLNTNVVGTNAAFRSFTSSSTSNGAQTIKADFTGAWSLQNNGGVYSLAYTSTPAIPEADGIVLLMAGLGAIAFVGRRRRDH
jgi:hypothetical protein